MKNTMGKVKTPDDSRRANGPHMERPELNKQTSEEQPTAGGENNDNNGNYASGVMEASDPSANVNINDKIIMDIIQSVSDTTVEEIRKQIEVEDEKPFQKPRKMRESDYQKICRALEVEKFLAPFLKSAKAPWADTDLEITQLIRGKDRTFCLWAPTRHLQMLKKVVKLALQRIVADQELASYEERVSFEEVDTSVCLQRQVGGYSMVSGGMSCEYDVPKGSEIEIKTSTVCAFLEENSEYYFLGTSHLHNLEGKCVYFWKKEQDDDRKSLGTIWHHVQGSNPFIEAFLGKLDKEKTQVHQGTAHYDQIHDGSVWELLGETIYVPLEGGANICEGKVEYLGRGRCCVDPDTGDAIDGSSLLFCRPVDSNCLSPPGSSGAGAFVREEIDGGVQNSLVAMNLFSIPRGGQEWAVCQHIRVPLDYFNERLGGAAQLELYNGECPETEVARISIEIITGD